MSKIIRLSLEKGFQIEPKAFSLISKYQKKDNIDILDIVKIIIKGKTLNYSEKIITINDIKKFFSPFENKARYVNLKSFKEDKSEIIINLNDKILLNKSKLGFDLLFKSRFNKLMNIIKDRPDYNRIEIISNIKQNKREGSKKIAGLVMKKKMSRNSIILSIDDNTGLIECTAFEKGIIEKVKQVLLDSFVICDVFFSKTGIPIIKSINLPDIPMKMNKLASNEVYAIFTSDIHVGSKNFLEESFNLFLNWLNNPKKEERKLVEKIRYLVIAGDVIDGIGIYPGQEIDLLNLNIKEQISKFTYLIKKIPKRIEVFIIPGNHDPVRQAIPQPSIPIEYSKELYNMENVRMLGNPSFIKLSNVDVLVYHGRSLDDVIATTPGYSFTRPAVAMKNLLRSRHLVPVYGERTSLAPDNEDNLVIENIPKIFHAGHIHTLDSEYYKGILMLNSGSWQSQTPYQAKMGIIPTPAIVPVVDLSTLNIISKDFRIIDIKLMNNTT